MRRLVRVAFVVVVMSAVFASSSLAANPRPIQIPLVAGLTASVRDRCTGAAVAGVVASLQDPATGLLQSPDATKTGKVVFQNLASPNPNLILHVSAPGYQPLGDAASPNPGVAITANPGPVNRTTTDPGPMQLPGEARLYEGLNVAIGLLPNAGCAAPRMVTVAALSGKVYDLSTGMLIPAPTVTLADPDTGAGNPGPVQVSNGSFKQASLSCGDYDLQVQATGYQDFGPGIALVVEQGCGTALGTAAMAWGNTVEIVMAPIAYNHAPVIDWITPGAYYSAIKFGSLFHVTALVHDPDPGDNTALVSQWTETGPNNGNPFCTIADPTALSTTLHCLTTGIGTLTFTVTDPHGATASASYFVVVKP